MMEKFPNADTELIHKQVNKVTDKLWKTIKKPEDILALGFEAFEKSIRSIGLYRSKAKHIRATSQILAQN